VAKNTPKTVRVSFADESWNNNQWQALLERLISSGLCTWKEITGLVLGHLNPSQVGTSLASSEGFKKKYGKGNTLEIVRKWLYAQEGKCADCGTRLELQADHSNPRESFENPLDADFIENMLLRCRRCNVIKRPSHEYGGTTHLTAESALMWIMFTFEPRTFIDFVRLCRLYGMTMSDIRMQEAWAMAHWVQSMHSLRFELDNGSKKCQLLLWESDNALTRKWEGDKIVGKYQVVVEDVPTTNDIVLVIATGVGDAAMQIHCLRQKVCRLPFSHYFSDVPQALAIRYVAPGRKEDAKKPPQILAAAPRDCTLLALQCIPGAAIALVQIKIDSKTYEVELTPDKKSKKIADVSAEQIKLTTAKISAKDVVKPSQTTLSACESLSASEVEED
jgi:5-methylcytosine-specific restriction endonuclease McrA